MKVFVLNWSSNRANTPWSGYYFYSSLEKAEQGKIRLIKENDEWEGYLASDSKTGEYCIRIYEDVMDHFL